MIWSGYPHSVSILQFSGITRQVDHDGDSLFNPFCDYEVIYGCEGQYIKWLNDLGGYSYWLFNPQYKDNIKTKSLGETENNYDSRLTALARVNSRGFQVEKSRRLTSKVDQLYMREIQSLMYSPEIYLYTGVKGSGVHSWIKVRISSGSFEVKDSKYNSTDVKLSIDLPELYTLKR